MTIEACGAPGRGAKLHRHQDLSDGGTVEIARSNSGFFGASVPPDSRPPQKKTAAPSGPRSGGGKHQEAYAKLQHAQCLNARSVAILSFVSVVNDDGHFCGLEAVQ
jgi:hypothetical protein